MEWRTKLGALLGAGGLLMLAASTAFALAPTYIVDLTKSANPATVPAAGGSVTYTLSVHNTGTGNFAVVTVDDGMVGCTLGAPTGDDGNGTLDSGETWAYTCVVTGVQPGTQNNASVLACHDAGGCSKSATDTASATVTGSEPPATVEPTLAPPTEAPPTEAPPTEAPPTDAPPTINPCDCTPDPTNEVQGEGDEPTAPNTATVDGHVVDGGSSNGIMLVIALGMLLASLVLVTPAKPVRSKR